MTANERDLDGLVAINDPLLRPLIVSDSEEERRAALEAILTEHAVPLVRKIVRQQSRRDRLLRAQDAEDIASSVVLRLLRKLQRVPFDADEAITRVTDFAATTTFNAIHDFQRHQFPEWTRLKQRVRYTLARDPRFRTWISPAGPACALASAPAGLEPGPPPLSWACPAGASEQDALEALLAAAGHPLLVGQVVDSLAEALKIVDRYPSSAAVDIADERACQATQLETRDRLAALWRETCALPPSQRVALLLNLRDGDGSSAIALFPLMGIASLDEVAAAIELPLPRLAKLWSSLPVDDLTIASILGVSRQKVINLRSSARQRLARRLRKW
jgi:DNA-directed RNA polymerase specialized sigma24 family protein